MRTGERKEPNAPARRILGQFPKPWCKPAPTYHRIKALPHAIPAPTAIIATRSLKFDKARPVGLVERNRKRGTRRIADKTMRTVKIPYDQGGEITKAVHRAEQKFLESLRAEASRSPVQTRRRVRAVQVPRSLGMRPGSAEGACGQDFHRAASYASAIKQGIHEARAHKEREDELTRDQSICSSHPVFEASARGFIIHSTRRCAPTSNRRIADMALATKITNSRKVIIVS
jgi:hypothetical protein